MAALAIVPPRGHACTLEAITVSGEFNQRERFAPIVQGLMDRSNDQLRVSGNAMKPGSYPRVLKET